MSVNSIDHSLFPCAYHGPITSRKQQSGSVEMTVTALRSVSKAQVSQRNLHLEDYRSNSYPERRRRIHPPMQAPRLPLLRLGRQQQGHEVHFNITLYESMIEVLTIRSKFLQSHLPTFAKKNPQIEITVSPRPGHHPVLRGVYMNGRERAICVRKMTPHEILEKAERLKSTSGEKQKKENRAGRRVVTSMNESVRGVWSPYHAKEAFKL